MDDASSNESFPVRLRAARDLRQLSQADLAKRSGLQASAVSHFETGTRKPSFANLRRLADALQVSIDYLLGRAAEPTSVGKSVDVMYRDIDKLSAHDRETISVLARQMAERSKQGGGRDGGES